MAGARSLCAFVGLVVASSTYAEPIAATFESMVHGEIITNQFADVGMSIEAENFQLATAKPVAFNSNMLSDTDPDLNGPNWTKGNLAPNTDLGMLIIIPENMTDANGDGIIDDPDDEGARPAGDLKFTFADIMTSFGFDVIDMEGPVREMSSIEFFLFGSSVATVDFNEFVTAGSDFYDPTVRFGNNSANRITPITSAQLGIDGFTSVVIHVGGSAAYDNIVVVPAPASGLMLGLGGLVLTRRRR